MSVSQELHYVGSLNLFIGVFSCYDVDSVLGGALRDSLFKITFSCQPCLQDGKASRQLSDSSVLRFSSSRSQDRNQCVVTSYLV